MVTHCLAAISAGAEEQHETPVVDVHSVSVGYGLCPASLPTGGSTKSDPVGEPWCYWPPERVERIRSIRHIHLAHEDSWSRVACDGTVLDLGIEQVTRMHLMI